jgi:hypothetical protein
MQLVLTFTDTRTAKEQHGDDDDSGIKSPSALLSSQLSSAKPPPLSQLNYLLVRYWNRKIWKSIAGTRKDTFEVQTKNRSCGGTRSSKGENVMMLYIEDANGTPIDGNTASGIRELARSIWRNLYERGIAPETWGQATMEVCEEFCREMESEYLVLRLCNYHWKANTIATAIYSQWHRTYYRKLKPHLDNDNSSEGDSSNGNNTNNNTGNGSSGPPRKKARTVVDVDAHFTLIGPETHASIEGMSINTIPHTLTTL